MIAQNKHNLDCAKKVIEEMPDEEKIKLKEELLKIGYEYNSNYEILLETSDVDIPYNFILLCLLEDISSSGEMADTLG